MIVVGDWYSFVDENGYTRKMQHANKIVFASGTVENPIISKVVEVDYNAVDDVSYYVEGVIRFEREGIDFVGVAESITEQTIFTTYRCDGFSSYTELWREQQNDRSVQDRNKDHRRKQQRGRSDSSHKRSVDEVTTDSIQQISTITDSDMALQSQNSTDNDC